MDEKLRDLIRKDITNSTPSKRMELKINYEKSIKNGAGWISFIGIASIINTLILFFDGSLNFIVGLGITQFIDGIFYSVGGDFKFAGLAINILIGAGFIVLGRIAKQSVKWAFIVTFIVYIIDALIFLFFGDYLGFGFHLFAIFMIWTGYKSINTFNIYNEEVEKMFPENEINETSDLP